MNRELKRRLKVIGISPNEDSLIRLMGSVLMEEYEKRQGATRIFRPEKYKEILASTIPDVFKCTAEEQQILRIA